MIQNYKTKRFTHTVYTYHFSPVGSTVAITDPARAIVNKYAYAPFGGIIGQSETIPQPFKFVGQFGVMAEPNGLYYMRARYYDPSLGRFISEDPLSFGGGDVNLMAYAGNNPVNWTDAMGLKVDLGKYVIHNSQVLSNLNQLNQQIVRSGISDSSFTIKVTGGDRYRDDEGSIRSATDNSIIKDSAANSAHLLDNGARAVDFQVYGVSQNTVKDNLSGTDFSSQSVRNNYTDGHMHVSLPNETRFNWEGGKNK